MLWAAVIYYYIEFILNSWYSKKLAGYGMWNQLKDLLPFYLISIIVSVGVWTFTFLEIPYLLMLPLQILSATLLYCTIYALMGTPEYYEVKTFFTTKILH
jgi:hypothetical protein